MKRKLAEFFRGMSDFDLFPPDEPVVTPSLDNSFAMVCDSFRKAGDSIRWATNEFEQTNKKTTSTNSTRK